MANFSPYANFGYMALKRQTDENAVVPDRFIRFNEQTLVPNYNIEPVQEIAGERERNIRSVKSRIDFSGGFTFNIESKQFGNFLSGLFGAPTTQEITANESYRHVFDLQDNPEKYTIDVQIANAPWVFRFFGTQVNRLSVESNESMIESNIDVMPRKAFITAEVTEDVSSGTTLKVDQTTGLTTSDTILVLNQTDGFTTLAELTISAIVSETKLTVSTIGASLTTGDIVVIKSQSGFNYNQDAVFSWLTQSDIQTGDTIDNVTSECKESITLEYTNEVEPRWCNSPTEQGRFPEEILTKGFTATGNVMKFYENTSNLNKLRANKSIALRLKLIGENALEANTAIKASSTWGATANGFKIEATTAGVAGNDISVTVAINTTDTLEVEKNGNTILIKLANTTPANNTGTLIAAAVDALTGVDATAEGTGAEQFTTAEDNVNLGFRQGTSTDVVGQDANEKPYIQFDNADGRLDAYFPSAAEDAIVEEDIPLTFYKDVESGDTSKKWTSRIYILNDVSSY